MRLDTWPHAASRVFISSSLASGCCSWARTAWEDSLSGPRNASRETAAAPSMGPRARWYSAAARGSSSRGSCQCLRAPKPSMPLDTCTWRPVREATRDSCAASAYLSSSALRLSRAAPTFLASSTVRLAATTAAATGLMLRTYSLRVDTTWMRRVATRWTTRPPMLWSMNWSTTCRMRTGTSRSRVSSSLSATPLPDCRLLMLQALDDSLLSCTPFSAGSTRVAGSSTSTGPIHCTNRAPSDTKQSMMPYVPKRRDSTALRAAGNRGPKPR
mmetsp:Transcript_13367/g.28592  ORF Transcript_13367/g.28592 Transcript_13367/m.28592 type:complete len:271 (-) Transcript_13367:1409-2221(-)